MKTYFESEHSFRVEGDRVTCEGDCVGPEPHWIGHRPVTYTMVNGMKEWVVRVGRPE